MLYYCTHCRKWFERATSEDVYCPLCRTKMISLQDLKKNPKILK